ncbi:antibiotic biosynthesis monooxygenase [Pseudomonas poae]|nr:antibiotic biosynthesis monooxygenase [Pseudomonas poae]
MRSPDRGTQFSQFVEFVVDPLHVQDLVTALIERVERFTRLCPGFISAQVHVSEAGDRVLMQLLWPSRQSGELAIERAQTVEPDLFHLARQHHASALFFSTFNALAQVCAVPASEGGGQ